MIAGNLRKTLHIYKDMQKPKNDSGKLRVGLQPLTSGGWQDVKRILTVPIFYGDQIVFKQG